MRNLILAVAALMAFCIAAYFVTISLPKRAKQAYPVLYKQIDSVIEKNNRLSDSIEHDFKNIDTLMQQAFEKVRNDSYIRGYEDAYSEMNRYDTIILTGFSIDSPYTQILFMEPIKRFKPSTDTILIMRHTPTAYWEWSGTWNDIINAITKTP